MSPIQLGNHNTYRHREDGESRNDQCDRKDPSPVRDRSYLSKPDRCKGDPRLIDRIHNGKIINSNIANRSNQHGHDSEDYRQTKCVKINVKIR